LQISVKRLGLPELVVEIMRRPEIPVFFFIL
jgi:hypothetical protein